MDYQEHVQKQMADRQKTHPIKAGDTVCWNLEYDIYRGMALKVNAKTVKVQGPHGERNIQSQKVLRADTPATLVWETWKGVNGSGGYRWDMSLYPKTHIPVGTIPHQVYLHENVFGAATAKQQQDYTDFVPVKRRNTEEFLKAMSGLGF